MEEEGDVNIGGDCDPRDYAGGVVQQHSSDAWMRFHAATLAISPIKPR
jgi:hypothetical protein